MDNFRLPTRVADAFHSLTSFGLWAGFCLEKSEIRPSDLASNPTLLLSYRQYQILNLREILVGDTGLEPVAFSTSKKRSSQLS